jgi:hypothetical protein
MAAVTQAALDGVWVQQAMIGRHPLAEQRIIRVEAAIICVKAFASRAFLVAWDGGGEA